MIASSGQYSFKSIKAELIIREAFELMGQSGSQVVTEQLEGAVNSINFLLTDLVNQNINLWTLKQIFLSLQPGQTKYVLPENLIKVTQIDLRTSYRELGGSAFSYQTDGTTADGVAANAFDGNPNTSCTQTAADGTIGYKFNTPQQLNFLSIRSATKQDYTIVFEASADGNNWTSLLNTEKTTYLSQTTVWFDIYNIRSYAYYRIRETGGATLNISELYFNDSIVDTALTEVSHYSYLKMPIKNNIGRPTIYSVDYQIVPVLNIWQAPDEQYNCLLLSYQSMIETLGSYTESINIPNSFYQAVVYGLAKSLAMKYAPDKLQLIAPEFDRALQSSIARDVNNVPLRFTPYVN